MVRSEQKPEASQAYVRHALLLLLDHVGRHFYILRMLSLNRNYPIVASLAPKCAQINTRCMWT